MTNEQQANMVFCHSCGKQMHNTATACPHCGAITSVKQPKRKRMVAALLAIFLGGFGVHKFYLGKIDQGIVYVLFFWTLIPHIIGFIEGIVYLGMSDEAFETKYG